MNKDEVIETKTIRKRKYDLDRRGEWYSIVTYNSIGIMEVCASYNSFEEAKIFFDDLTNK